MFRFRKLQTLGMFGFCCFSSAEDVSPFGRFQARLMEFIEGAARLRGNAKALDIWRIETKMEALFVPTKWKELGRGFLFFSFFWRVVQVLIEEVLKEMKSLPVLEGNSVKLQDVFDNSMLLSTCGWLEGVRHVRQCWMGLGWMSGRVVEWVNRVGACFVHKPCTAIED